MIDFVDRYSNKWFSLILSLSAATLLVWLLSSPMFRISSISLVRDYGSPPPLVDELELASRLSWTYGQSIFRLGTEALAAQLEEEPSVRSAAVETHLDGSLLIRVTHRRPVANWQVGEQSFLVDETARLLAVGSDPALTLTIRDLETTDAQIGDIVNLTVLKAGYILKENLPLLALEPLYITHSGAAGITVTTTDVIEILFGPPESLEAKLVSLKAVLDDAARQGIRVRSVDLRPIERPTYKAFDSTETAMKS
jgi:cell division septal protein FtsQ